MKKLAIAVLFLAATLSAADYSGIWNGKGGLQDAKYGVLPQNVQVTLLQAGNKVSGTIKFNNEAPVKFTSGTVNGNQITVIATRMGAQMTGVLTASGGQLQGRLTTSTAEVYTFAFTKLQQ